jgi:hypothetical protein
VAKATSPVPHSIILYIIIGVVLVAAGFGAGRLSASQPTPLTCPPLQCPSCPPPNNCAVLVPGTTPPAAPESPPALQPPPQPDYPKDGYVLNTTIGSCYDSDRGITAQTKGYILDAQGVMLNDSCNGNTLTEYYCSELYSALAGSSAILCDSCVDGRCVPIEKQALCTDTDKGMNYILKGIVTDAQNRIYEDNCSTTKILFEYYCDGFDNAQKRSYLCPISCQDGACTS